MIPTFPITQVDRVVRRTLVSAGAVGVIAIGASLLLGYPLVAPGILVGLGMAVLNHRLFQTSAVRFTDDEGSVARRPFASTVFLRLGACTAVAVLLLVFVRPMGWGVVGALAGFQALMLLNSIVALIGYQRQEGSAGGA